MIKTQEDFFNNIFTSHFIARVRKGLLRVCVWERAGDRTETTILWPQTYGRQRCVFLVLQGCSTGGPGPTLLGYAFLYCILSASSLDPKLHQGPKPLRPSVAFPTTSHSNWLQLNWHSNSTGTSLARQTQLSYIIVRRPLDLWNRMFNRHQAEITVMQFRGHSLPVHHSVVAQWDLHLVPYYQP